MTREEFLRELRIALQGRIPQSQVNEQLRYYENYIIEESRKGRSVEEVIASLGNPRLIAKTITAAFGDGIYYEDRFTERQKQKRKKILFDTWYKRLIFIFLIIIILIFLVKIGILLFPFAAAIFMVGAIVRLLFMIFFGNKK